MLYCTIKTLSDGRVCIAPLPTGRCYTDSYTEAVRNSERVRRWNVQASTYCFRNVEAALQHIHEANRPVEWAQPGAVGYVGAEGCQHRQAWLGRSDTYATWN